MSVGVDTLQDVKQWIRNSRIPNLLLLFWGFFDAVPVCNKMIRLELINVLPTYGHGGYTHVFLKRRYKMHVSINSQFIKDLR